MKRRIVLSMLLVSAGLFCPAVQADEDSELQLRQLSAEIKLLQKQIKRQEKEMAALRAENRRLKTGGPARPAGPEPGASPKDAQAMGDAGWTPPLTDMDAMLLAVRKAKQHNLADPRRSAQWSSMTTIQQEDALAEYRARVAEWEKKPKTDWRGKKVNWPLRVEDVQLDKETDGYVLVAKSKEGYLAMAMFPKESREEVASLRRGQSVALVGTIKDYKDSGERPQSSPRLRRTRPEKPVFLGVEVKSIPTFGVKLTDPKLMAGPNDEVDIAGLTFNANNIIYLVDRSGSMTELFPSVKSHVLQSVDRLSEEQRFQIVFFSEGSRALFKTCVSATPGNKLRTKKLLAPVVAEGQTHAMLALQEIAKYTRPRKNTAVVLIMDGSLDPEDRLAALKAFKKLGVPVHAILYGNKPEDAVEFMKRVAKETKGQYRYVPRRPRGARKR